MTRIRTFLVLILISLIVTLSIHLTEKFSDKVSTASPLQPNADVDYSIDDFTLTSMGLDGRTQYHMNASSMKHYQQSDEALLVTPEIKLHNEFGESWQVKAENGRVQGNNRSILLTGKVKLQQSATNQKKPFMITTESLLINIETNTISTNKIINLTGDGISLRSKGMFTNMQTETVKFLNKVRVTYAP
ncbi:MAG: LPS export ABC transporter periplasmic protein LptC [Gammaproteobacteria bacterium]|nr:LPS export ABC transporter periplasmic protein LptC [Gammaproteobacteria bacterium]